MMSMRLRYAKPTVDIPDRQDSPTFDQFIGRYVQSRDYIHQFVLPGRGMNFVLYEWYDTSIRDVILPGGGLNAKRRKDRAEAKIYFPCSRGSDYYIVLIP